MHRGPRPYHLRRRIRHRRLRRRIIIIIIIIDGQPARALRSVRWCARSAPDLMGSGRKLWRVLSDPSVSVVIVEHRDRLARFGVEHLEAALGAHGRRIVVADSGETTDDVVRDKIEVLTSMCARLYGRRGARNRAMRAVTATKAEPGRVA